MDLTQEAEKWANADQGVWENCENTAAWEAAKDGFRAGTRYLLEHLEACADNCEAEGLTKFEALEGMWSLLAEARRVCGKKEQG